MARSGMCHEAAWNLLLTFESVAFSGVVRSMIKSCGSLEPRWRSRGEVAQNGHNIVVSHGGVFLISCPGWSRVSRGFWSCYCRLSATAPFYGVLWFPLGSLFEAHVGSTAAFVLGVVVPAFLPLPRLYFLLYLSKHVVSFAVTSFSHLLYHSKHVVSFVVTSFSHIFCFACISPRMLPSL